MLYNSNDSTCIKVVNLTSLLISKNKFNQKLSVKIRVENVKNIEAIMQWL